VPSFPVKLAFLCAFNLGILVKRLAFRLSFKTRTPPILAMELERVRLSEKEVLLLGTAHISTKSVEEVKEAIEKEMPDVVGVELDFNRLRQLKLGNRWQETNIGKIISSGQTYLFLFTLMLSNFQRSLGQKLGIKPGMEMVEAVRIAEEKNIPIMLLDRDINITLKRAMHKMKLTEKIKLLYSILLGFFSENKIEITTSTIEGLKEKDVLNRLMQELAREMPSIKSILVDERDAYIARAIENSPGKKILAVVGAGHIEGIKRHFGEKIDIAAITTVPKGTNYMKIIGYVIPAIFIVLIAALFYFKGGGVTLTAIAYWALATGTLAALGVIIARGHPLTVLASFLAAPVTTLHPLLAAGWVAGYVEAKMRNPKVKDFENLSNLNSLGDFTNNQVTRILLVVALANVGATLGVIIGIPLVASLFG